MSKARILIIEDEQVNVTVLSLMLKELDYEIAGIAMDYQQAVEMLDRVNPDIVLVDIMLGNEKDGILLGHLIQSKYKKPFIFITSLKDKETIKKAALTNPDGYLVKPYNEAEIYAAIEVAMNNPSDTGRQLPDVAFIDQHIFVKDEYKYIKLGFKEIRYIKAEGNYIRIQTTGKNLMIRSSLGSFKETLPPGKFFQTQKSYIINLDHLDSITGNEVILGEESIPLSRNFKEQLIKAINIS